MSLTKRISALAAATLTSIAALAAVPTASAAPGSAVLFGDSIAANPTAINYVINKVNPAAPVPTTGVGCATDNAIPHKYTAKTGQPMISFACAGASFTEGGMHISAQINKAIRTGKLNGNTSTVVLYAGANDTYTKVLNSHKSVGQMGAELQAAMTAAIKQIKARAPRATVKVMGYPSITNPAGHTCVIGQLPPTNFDRLVPAIERKLEEVSRNAANATGAQFISLKAASKGHDLCLRDPWIAPLIASPKPANLPFHYTAGGLNQAVARM